MNNESSGKIVALGCFGLIGFASAKSATLFKQAGSRGPVNRAVNSPAAQQRTIGGVHDRVNL
jgi:hypothetical protein